MRVLRLFRLVESALIIVFNCCVALLFNSWYASKSGKRFHNPTHLKGQARYRCCYTFPLTVLQNDQYRLGIGKVVLKLITL